MIDFINKIGQRKISKILVVLAGILGVAGFIKNGGIESLIAIRFAIGILIFVLPNAILSLAAHNSKEHRYLAIVVSSLFLTINSVLFFMKALDFMFFLLLVQIVLGVGLLFFISMSKNNQKKSEKMITEHTRQQEKARAARPKLDKEPSNRKNISL